MCSAMPLWVCRAQEAEERATEAARVAKQLAATITIQAAWRGYKVWDGLQVLCMMPAGVCLGEGVLNPTYPSLCLC